MNHKITDCHLLTFTAKLDSKGRILVPSVLRRAAASDLFIVSIKKPVRQIGVD